MSKVLSYVRDMENPWQELKGADVILDNSITMRVKKRERLNVHFGNMEENASTVGKELVELALIMLFSEKHNFVSEIRFPSAIPEEWEKNKNQL